ncbi:MAG: valine--tRNA ligase [Candidatus Magasanikbacteria bacterium]
MKEFPKAYEPQKYEKNIYTKWEESGLFNPDVCIEKGITDKKAQSFSMVLPPPNVTGTLHMGHAAMLAIEDTLIRYHRMKGEKTLWVPGTDHAAVATESKVESLLIEKEGMTKPKEELGREKFLERVRKFAQDSHDTIVNQSKRMGSSLDWSREAYTLDETRNLAVRMVFKKMYDDGLIYRGYRVINWSVKGQSTCSDDELVYVERPAKMYYFKYHKDFPITIATTRPETKLGDTAVAVHPEGKYKKYIGQVFEVENVGQIGHTLKIKIIGDENVDETLGTGALGVTPAHSMVDFEMYERQKREGDPIDLIQVIGEDGKMTNNAGKEYKGLTTLEAREKFLEYLQSEGLFLKEEDIVQSAGTSDRFKDVVEPLPKTQWFINVNKEFTQKEKTVTLKKLMQDAVRDKHIEIVPERFDKTYFSWVDNLRDWCISRQIWFGHQIPVWYRGEEIFCGISAPEGEGWTQDPDTLDTWFSSGIWTFSTLLDTKIKEGESLEAWLERSKDYKDYHPTSVLETGYDIIFFWVARMILMTTYTIGEVPFKKVYLHGLVRDDKGRKMSKSLGNIINPLDMIEKYGADATRLSLMMGTSPGNDMKLSEEKVEGLRNFANKLWNISRFMVMNIEEPKVVVSMPEAKTLADKWILETLSNVTNTVSESLEKMNFSFGAEKLRDFTWNDLADWYLEIAKVEGEKKEILNYILNTILKLWHPFMPFVTEAIWQEIYGEDALLMVEKWLEQGEDNEYVVTADFNNLQYIITKIRNIRAEKGIPPGKKIDAFVKAGENTKFVEENMDVMKSLARIENLEIVDTLPENMVTFVDGGVEMALDFSDAVDTDAERERLQKEIEHIEPYVLAQEKKLGNGEFVNNAPESVVNAEKKKLSEAKEKLIKLQEQLTTLA